MFSFHFLLKRSQTFLKKLHFSFIICTALLTSHILTFLKSWILIFIETSVFILIMKSFCLLFVEEERKQYFQRINKFFLLDQYGLFITSIHHFNYIFIRNSSKLQTYNLMVEYHEILCNYLVIN